MSDLTPAQKRLAKTTPESRKKAAMTAWETRRAKQSAKKAKFGYKIKKFLKLVK